MLQNHTAKKNDCCTYIHICYLGLLMSALIGLPKSEILSSFMRKISRKREIHSVSASFNSTLPVYFPPFRPLFHYPCIPQNLLMHPKTSIIHTNSLFKGHRHYHYHHHHHRRRSNSRSSSAPDPSDFPAY